MEKKRPLNKSLIKGLSVLESFKEQSHALSFSKLAALNGDMDKSSVQRAIETLRAAGYLCRTSKGQDYSLGIRILDLAFAFLRSHPQVHRVGPYLIDLRQSSGERVDFSLLDGTDLVYVLRMPSKRDRYTPVLVGRRWTLIGTAGGHAVLSHMPAKQVAEIFRETHKKAKTKCTATDLQRLMGVLNTAREAGFAFHQDPVRRGSVAVGAAILDRSGAPIGALHIVGSIVNWDPEEFRAKMGALVVAAAAEINSH